MVFKKKKKNFVKLVEVAEDIAWVFFQVYAIFGHIMQLMKSTNSKQCKDCRKQKAERDRRREY